eukprot:g2368.t1
MGCCTSSNATKGKKSSNKKVLSSLPSATSDIVRARSLSASDLDYMSDDDYGDSDSDNGDNDPINDHGRQDSSRRKHNIIDLATYRFLNPFNRQIRHRFGDHTELKAGKVKLIPQSVLPNAQTKDSIIFSSSIIYYKIKKNKTKKSAVKYSISKEIVASICVTIKNIYILTKVVRSKKLKVWKLYNKSNVNVLKLLFITSSRTNDDLILHFTEDLGGDMYIKCEENKGELISVLETLHRVKLDASVNVTIVKETKNELVQKYFRANRQELASEKYHRTSSYKAQQRKVINDFNERLKITSFTPYFVLGIGTYGKSTLVEKTSGRDSIYYSANGNNSTPSSKNQSRRKIHRQRDMKSLVESDYWSLGILIYELFCGAYPFTTDGEIPDSIKLEKLKDIRLRILRASYTIPAGGIPPDVVTYINALLVLNPSDRSAVFQDYHGNNSTVNALIMQSKKKLWSNAGIVCLLKNTSNKNTVGNNFVTSPTSGKSFRYNKLRDSYAHEMNNDACLSDFRSYWKPSFDLQDDIINMKYFDSHTCMAYDDYADLQQTQEQASKANTIGYATQDRSMKSLKSRRRSSGASDRSDRLSVISDDGVYENGGKIQISITGLANTMTTNPLSIKNAMHKTPQSNSNHSSDSENSDDGINNNVTNAARKRSPTAIEVQAEIERHLEDSKHTATPRKRLPMNYVVSNDNQDDFSESSSSSSESSSDDDQGFAKSYKKKNKHILLAKKLAKTTKISSLISNAVCNREIELEKMENGK